MSNKIKSIEIHFDCPITLSDDNDNILMQVVENICRQYNKENINRHMWLAQFGSKILWNEPNEPDSNPDIIEIICHEDEDDKGLNRNNPDASQKRKEFKEKALRIKLNYDKCKKGG